MTNDNNKNTQTGSSSTDSDRKQQPTTNQAGQSTSAGFSQDSDKSSRSYQDSTKPGSDSGKDRENRQ